MEFALLGEIQANAQRKNMAPACTLTRSPKKENLEKLETVKEKAKRVRKAVKHRIHHPLLPPKAKAKDDLNHQEKGW